jgi:hypothetical protein
MAAESTVSEKGMGAAMLCSLLAVGGAVLMHLEGGEPLAGWGFAVAMLAGSLAVAAVHLW